MNRISSCKPRIIYQQLQMGLILDTSFGHLICSKSDDVLQWSSINFKQIADTATLIQNLVVLTKEPVKRLWVSIIDIFYKPFPSISSPWIAEICISI